MKRLQDIRSQRLILPGITTDMIERNSHQFPPRVNRRIFNVRHREAVHTCNEAFICPKGYIDVGQPVFRRGYLVSSARSLDIDDLECTEED